MGDPGGQLYPLIVEFAVRLKARTDLEMNASEYRVFCRMDHINRPAIYERSGVVFMGAFCEGLVVSGVPVGTSEFVSHELKKRVAVIVSDNDKLNNLLQNRNPFAEFAIVRYCRAPQFTFMLQSSYPSDIESSGVLVPLQSSIDAMVSGGIGSAEWSSDDITKRRVRLPVRAAGMGIRDLGDVMPAAFLGTICQVFPVLIDTSVDGVVIPGWAPELSVHIGVGAFDPAAQGRGRLTALLAANVSGVPLRIAEEIRDAYGRCRVGLSQGELSEGPLAASIQDFGFGYEFKCQRAITKQREQSRCAALLAEVKMLPAMDPRRMSFMEMSDSFGGAAIRCVINAFPMVHNPIMPRQWVSGICSLFGIALPALVPFVGNPIKGVLTNLCDAHGHNLAAAHLKGDGWRRGHNNVQDAVVCGLEALGIPSTLEPYNLFKAHISASAREHLGGDQAYKNQQGIIPDLAIGLDPMRLGEIKGITPSKSRYDIPSSQATGLPRRNTTNYAVQFRAGNIAKDYIKSAKKLDIKHNGTAVGQRGPMEIELRRYGAWCGDEDRCIEPLSFGFFGGISREFDSLMRTAAAVGAQKKFITMESKTMEECTATLLWQYRQRVGVALFRQNADLVLDRIQFLTGGASRERIRQASARSRFFAWGDEASSTYRHQRVGSDWAWQSARGFQRFA